jgi:hypothetical protein
MFSFHLLILRPGGSCWTILHDDVLTFGRRAESPTMSFT